MSQKKPRTRIITGFKPFGTHRYNPSWDCAQALAGHFEREASLLPVTYQAAAQFAPSYVARARHRSLDFIHLGLAAKREEVCIEACAKNRRCDTPDATEDDTESALPNTQPLIAGAVHKRRSTFDIQGLVRAYNRSRTPTLPIAQSSHDCGTYVCNALYYHGLRICERAPHDRHRVLFIHIPPSSPQKARSIGAYLGTILSPM